MPALGGINQQLTFGPPLGIALNIAHYLAEQRMEKILDFDDAQIAGIIRQRLLTTEAMGDRSADNNLKAEDVPFDTM